MRRVAAIPHRSVVGSRTVRAGRMPHHILLLQPTLSSIRGLIERAAERHFRFLFRDGPIRPGKRAHVTGLGGRRFGEMAGIRTDAMAWSSLLVGRKTPARSRETASSQGELHACLDPPGRGFISNVFTPSRADARK